MNENFNERLASIIANDVAKENLGHIDLHKARELLMDAGAVLFDVRPPAKVEGENAQEAGIKNAHYTPYPAFAASLDLLPEDKTTPIITACVKGWFGNRVMAYLEMMGYANVYILDTSVTALIEAHYAHSGR
ncbi:rhodanese-like domain-containing protein [Sulfurimonas sp. HSL-3221]|uniref:rhodanese-like domain-containing protein n=1 Tax=Sulfurimonadaceae TaxID=2771471 RepID=UPI001E4D3065|nr:rhodanese-like domain-containing protein [Sulfurimonas sp. HSL-3221]UFS62854.1 rhodanese-like domain-containing protein [Sulfurimonas sp. HSL-3221]